MSAEEELFSLACQDMPVTSDEVRQAMNAWAHELAEKQRKLAAPAAMLRSERMQGFAEGARAAADLIDPGVLNSGG